MERHVFSADDNRCQQSCKSHDHLSCSPNQSQDGYFRLYWPCLSFKLGQFSYRFVVRIYRGTLVLLCDVSFISVVEPQFLLYVEPKLQHFLVADFILYICMPGVFHVTERDKSAASWWCDSVAVVFILLWKLKFLAYLLSVTKRFVMCIISYANVVYFICNYCSWLTLRRLMSYIYGAPILDVSRSHTTTQHSR